MKSIPTQAENPNGLHQRYRIQKIVPKSEYERDAFFNDVQEFKTVNCDRGSEYFVMRLDEGGKDLNHIKACRIGIHSYADAIEPHIPELAKDLRERYPLL